MNFNPGHYVEKISLTAPSRAERYGLICCPQYHILGDDLEHVEVFFNKAAYEDALITSFEDTFKTKLKTRTLKSLYNHDDFEEFKDYYVFHSKF